MMLKRPLHIVPAYQGRDPMVMGAVWIGYDLPALDVTESMVVVPQLDDIPQQYYNQHVMDYWDWRLDQLGRAIGRK